MGIEHASTQKIVDALNNVYTTSVEPISDITLQDLFSLQLIGSPNSKFKRKKLV